MVEYRSGSLAGAEALACLALGRRYMNVSRTSDYYQQQQQQNQLEPSQQQQQFEFEDQNTALPRSYMNLTSPSPHIRKASFSSESYPPPVSSNSLVQESTPLLLPPIIPFQFGTPFMPPPPVLKSNNKSTKSTSSSSKRFPLPVLPLDLPTPPPDLHLTACSTLAQLLEPGTRERLPAGFLAVLSELLVEGLKGTSGEIRGESKIARALHEFLHPSPLPSTSTATSSVLTSALSNTSKLPSNKPFASNSNRDSKKRKIEAVVNSS